MTAPRVSAIITTYNYRRFITGAIESVLGQTRPPDEIVVVDDGSTDDTAALVAAYADRGVRYVWQPNRGAGAVRNRGLAETTGELVAFLDGDDRWLPEKTALQLDHLARYPQAGIVSGSEVQVYEDGTPPYLVRRPAVGAAWLYRQLLIENSLGNPSLLLIRRACFVRAGGFAEDIPLGQDWEMWVRLARICRVGIVDAPLIEFNRHGGSMTAGQVWRRYHANRALHRRYLGAIRNPLRRLWIERAAQSMNLFYTAAALIDAPAQRRVALPLAAAAFALDPLYQGRAKGVMLGRALVGPHAFAVALGLRARLGGRKGQ